MFRALQPQAALIGPAGREALQKYRYNAEDLSLIAPYFQRFWTAVCAALPSWLAPNCVTVAGLLLLLLSAELCRAESPHFDAPLPSSRLLLHAALLFGYQTLDAVDGKQARRTGSSGPLGELCDHTVDALACTLLTFTLASTLLAGRTVLLLWLVGTAPFGLCTWRMLHTGKMTLPQVNGPNEGMAILYGTCLATALAGQSRLWGESLLRLPGVGAVRPPDVFAAVGVTMGLVDSVGIFRAVAAALRVQSGSMAVALSHLLPYCVLAGSVVAWAALSPSDVLLHYAYPLLLGAGFHFALLMGRLILAHLTHERERLMLSMLVPLAPLPLAAVNAWAGAPVPEPIMVWLNLAFGAAAYFGFAARVAAEISQLLGIRVFSLSKPPAAAAAARQAKRTN